MSKQTFESMRPTQYALPEELKVIDDPSHPLYDTRIELPLDPALKDSIAAEGVYTALLCRRDGEKLEVIDGRQRVRAVEIINKERKRDGVEPLKLPVRVIKLGDDLSVANAIYASNIHVEDPPEIRARKVSDAVNKRGMSKAQVALAMGVTPQAVDNWLALLDCSARVQAAVKDGKLSETVARQFAGMERADQDKTLAEMLAKGVTSGSTAVHAVRRAKRGKPIPDKPARGAGKTRSRSIIEGTLEHLEAYPEPPVVFALLVNYTKWVLGDNTVRESLPDEVLECIAAAMGDLK